MSTYPARQLDCDGATGQGCPRRGAVTHVAESPKDKHGNHSFRLMCGSCALVPHGDPDLGPARKLTPAEHANHVEQQRDQDAYDYDPDYDHDF